MSFTGGQAVSAATKTAMKGGTEPVWEETLALPVVADPEALLVKVFNQNRASPDDLIGYGRAPGEWQQVSGSWLVEEQLEARASRTPALHYPSPTCTDAVYDVLNWGSAELAVPLTAHPSGLKQGFVHLHLEFRPLPADQAEAAAQAHMQSKPRRGWQRTQCVC